MYRLDYCYYGINNTAYFQTFSQLLNFESYLEQDTFGGNFTALNIYTSELKAHEKYFSQRG